MTPNAGEGVEGPVGRPGQAGTWGETAPLSTSVAASHGMKHELAVQPGTVGRLSQRKENVRSHGSPHARVRSGLIHNR